MGEPDSPPVTTGRLPRAAIVLVLLTGIVCATAIVFRNQIRSRVWAGRVIASSDAAERATYLTLLCNAGDGGRWGTSVLLDHPEATIRQHGVVVLHHVDTAWARERLARLLNDPDANVAELAALGLAIHGDNSVIPRLRQLYEGDSNDAARAACIALGRLATPPAVAELTAFAEQHRDVERVAALVDALEDVGTAAAVPALLKLLADERPCHALTRRELRAREVLQGLTGGPPLGAAASPDLGSASSIASRAADALGRITGIFQPHSTTMPVAAREAARAEWERWHRDQ